MCYKILAPTDLSEASFRAVRQAMLLAERSGAELTLLRVLPSPEITNEGAELKIEEDHFSDVIRDYAPPKLNVDTAVRYGDVTVEVLRLARDGKFDLIVMATHGASGWREFVLGSITDEVVRLAPCPVLTIGHDSSQKGNGAIATVLSAMSEKSEQTKVPPPEPDEPVSTKPQIDSGEADFPLNGSPEEKWRFLLQYAILAPSNRNSQPWLWRVNGNKVELYADRTRALPHLDPDDRELILSCGAALLHLRVAIRHFGFVDKVAVLPDQKNPDLLAVVELGENSTATPDEERLFEAIPLRHTNRYPFLERDLSASLKTDLKNEAKREGMELILVEHNEMRWALVNIIARSSRKQGHDPLFVEETLSWIRSDRDRFPSADGIPQEAMGGGGISSHYATDVGAAQSEKDQLLAASAPLLGVLETKDDRPRDWLGAGQALARVLLLASANGVQASFFNGPVEIVTLWPQLHDVLKQAGLPQFILRLGYPSQEVDATPRRQVDEVLEVVR